MFVNLRGAFAHPLTNGDLLSNPGPLQSDTYGLRAFSDIMIAAILWNDLPIPIRSVDDVHKFKPKLKSEFMNYLRILFLSVGVFLCFC